MQFCLAIMGINFLLEFGAYRLPLIMPAMIDPLYCKRQNRCQAACENGPDR